MSISDPAEFRVRFWGVRGSIPTPGPFTTRYGGNTTCVSVDCGDKLIVIDSGSGIRVLGDQLVQKRRPVEVYMLFSHFHWDHIQGFPFFTPAFIKGNVFNIYSERKINANIHTVLEGQMMYPNFPVTLDELESTIIYHEIAVGNTFPLTEDIHITTAPLNHPGGAVSFRIEYKGRRLVTAWDTEHYTAIDQNLLKQAEGADLLIYDATYTDDEYYGRTGNSAKIGWGHSTWQEAIKLAKASGVKKLILTHHDPTHADDFMDKINDAIREQFSDSQVAFEGLLLDL